MTHLKIGESVLITAVGRVECVELNQENEIEYIVRFVDRHRISGMAFVTSNMLTGASSLGLKSGE